MIGKVLRRLLVGLVVTTIVTLLLAGPAWSDTRGISGSAGSSGSGSSSGSAALPLPSPRGLAALAIATTQTGKPYVWGGTGPHGWDCSGLVQWAFRQVGVDMPRTTWQQATVGVPVPVRAMAPGDVVVLNDDGSHVGIYAGFGQIFNAYGRGVPVGLSPIKQFTIYAVRRF
ncbi:NlpC/P60 family protein [Nocardia amikacinitolerans]|uniref:NlpC/P60 family protein n=1 Tax=Nocardia amikacinitolerans TaxID=756689 RepID=A0A285LS92_9NOCA|nr:NlpC/P60 family protein [Nocardia amikacinitolerans]MCP2299757.1 NlpC/P60 family protein [Nocardia amikacinitolerans]SNY86977.1 NlpC/P60 family protein [Nocardia amikacinitolerans]